MVEGKLMPHKRKHYRKPKRLVVGTPASDLPSVRITVGSKPVPIDSDTTLQQARCLMSSWPVRGIRYHILYYERDKQGRLHQRKTSGYTERGKRLRAFVQGLKGLKEHPAKKNPIDHLMVKKYKPMDKGAGPLGKDGIPCDKVQELTMRFLSPTAPAVSSSTLVRGFSHPAAG